MTPQSGKAESISELRKKILAMQGFSRPCESEVVRTGLGAIEQAFPNQTFPTGAIHEFTSAIPKDGAATNGFLAGLISCLAKTGNKGKCVWVSAKCRIFPPALKRFGIEPERVIFIDAGREKEALWTIEEALKCKALCAVVGELNHLDFTASRRLQLAVESSRVTGFIHRYQPRKENAVACVSRWRITPMVSAHEDDAPGLGFPKWNVQLVKVRNGQPGAWPVEWTTNGFRQVPVLSRSYAQLDIAKTG